MIDATDLRDCRDRDGSPADTEDRPDWVNDWHSADVILGYGEGLPLVNSDNEYEDYPRESERLLDPHRGEWIRALLDHPYVESFDDAAEELPRSISRQNIEDAADIHGIDEENCFSDDASIRERLTELHDSVANALFQQGEDSDCPEGHIRLSEDSVFPLDGFRKLCYEDSRLIGTLLAELGMGVEEATEFINYYCDEHSPDEGDIRNVAQITGLLEGGAKYEYFTQKAMKRKQERQNQMAEDQRRELYSDSQPSDSDNGDSGESTPSDSSSSF